MDSKDGRVGEVASTYLTPREHCMSARLQSSNLHTLRNGTFFSQANNVLSSLLFLIFSPKRFLRMLLSMIIQTATATVRDTSKSRAGRSTLCSPGDVLQLDFKSTLAICLGCPLNCMLSQSYLLSPIRDQ